MKRAKKATVRERLADLLELPGDLAYNGSILEYRSDHLLVLTGNGKIRIQGVALHVLYYTELEMKVTGQITSVLYEI